MIPAQFQPRDRLTFLKSPSFASVKQSNTMSARKIRPRLNIDLDAPLPVTFEDNPEADSIGLDEELKGDGEVKKPPTQKSVYASMMDKHDKEPKFGEVIEIPVVTVLPEFEAECDQAKIHFQRPEAYIRYEPTEDEVEQKFIEYDLDEEDESFVERIRARAEDNNLTEDELELIIDYFEKQSFKQREFKQLRLDAIKSDIKESAELPKAPGLVEDEDVPCCVCNERDSSDDNLIVFCDGCDIAIHQVCQGLQSIPEGTWLCDRCAYANEKKPSKQAKQTSLVSFCTPGHATYEPNEIKCMMCPERAGAMKRTSCGQWIHIACALWIPELYFSSDLKAVKTDRLPPARMGLECEVCGIKGGCIQCTEKRCYSAYHATCAQLNPVTHMIKIEEDEKTGDMNYVSYCRRHTAIKRNENLQKVATKEDLEVDIGRFIDKNTKKEVQRRCGRKFSKTLFNEICEYWKQKRFARKHGRRPLLRSLRVVVEEEQQQEKAAGRRIVHAQKKVLVMLRECTNFDKYEEMKSLRLSMERVRLLTDQIKKRELVKKRHLMNMLEMFNLTLGIKPQKQEEEPQQAIEVTDQQDNKLEIESVPVKPLVLAQAEVKARTSPAKKKVQKTPAPVRELSSSQNVIRSIENVINETSNSSQGQVTKTSNEPLIELFDEEDKENSNQPPVVENNKPANVTNKPAVTSPLRKSVATIQSKLTFFFKT